MGFSLKKWIRSATTVPKSLRKINIGKQVRRTVTGALSNLEQGISGSGKSLGETVDDVGDASRTVKMLPWLIGGALLLVFIWKRGK